MKILILGTGAREHALADGLAKKHQVFLAPKRVFLANHIQSIAVDICNPKDVLTCALDIRPDFIIIGPEMPLFYGVSDILRQHGFLVLGPSQYAAQIETSKVFAKTLMRQQGIRTADFCVIKNQQDLDHFCAHHQGPAVVKADGLMAGKGVLMCDSNAQIKTAAQYLWAQGQHTLLIESRLNGPEVSLMAICHGRSYALFPLARDYKRLHADKNAPNTGGMGSFAPLHLSAQEFSQHQIQNIQDLGHAFIAPVLDAFMEQKQPYIGFLYAGLLFHQGVFYALEYNARLGDPETQSILTILDQDLGDLFSAFVQPQQSPTQSPMIVASSHRHAVCVVLAAAGYPDKPQLGAVITGIKEAQQIPQISIFGAGIGQDEHQRFIVTGGRVLSVVAYAATQVQAQSLAYQAAACIDFTGKTIRNDIATE